MIEYRPFPDDYERRRGFRLGGPESRRRARVRPWPVRVDGQRATVWAAEDRGTATLLVVDGEGEVDAEAAVKAVCSQYGFERAVVFRDEAEDDE